MSGSRCRHCPGRWLSPGKGEALTVSSGMSRGTGGASGASALQVIRFCPQGACLAEWRQVGDGQKKKTDPGQGHLQTRPKATGSARPLRSESDDNSGSSWLCHEHLVLPVTHSSTLLTDSLRDCTESLHQELSQREFHRDALSKD